MEVKMELNDSQDSLHITSIEVSDLDYSQFKTIKRA